MASYWPAAHQFSQLPKAGSNAAIYNAVAAACQHTFSCGKRKAPQFRHFTSIAYRDVHRRWRSHRRAHLLSIRHTGHVTADSRVKVVKSLQVLWQAWTPGLAEPLTSVRLCLSAF